MDKKFFKFRDEIKWTIEKNMSQGLTLGLEVRSRQGGGSDKGRGSDSIRNNSNQ